MENFLMSVKCKVLIMSGCLCKNGKLLINLTYRTIHNGGTANLYNY